MKIRNKTIIGIVLSFSAALAYGLSTVLIRSKLVELETPPLVGSALSLVGGTILLSVFAIRDLYIKKNEIKKASGFMLLVGILSGGGIALSYFALSVAPVTIVSPLTGIYPLFSLLWSFLFLGSLEKITMRVVLGTFVVAIGVILVTIGQHL
jgi:drug/metabolite transporter (DMT)-like permease